MIQEVAKVFRHVPGGRVPLGRPLRQRLQADPFQFPGDRIVDLARWASLSLSHLLDDLPQRIAPEWSSPRQHLVQHDSQAKDVRTPIDPVTLASCLLGTHVGWRASQSPASAGILVFEHNPKSATQGLPEASMRMLAGLMSRCTSPWVCA